MGDPPHDRGLLGRRGGVAVAVACAGFLHYCGSLKVPLLRARPGPPPLQETLTELEQALPVLRVEGAQSHHFGVKTSKSSPFRAIFWFRNPNARGEQIIYEPGWPEASDPVHAGPYLRVSRNGRIYRIPLKRNEVS